ncbi:MAG: GDSL-type esterase/lipase family protein [Bacilli bacterium]|nr:GDSL-type esterase/lipase family protein [Bacilli bacterium]
MNIAELDKNFALEKNEAKNMVLLGEESFSLFGLFKTKKGYSRINPKSLRQMPPNIKALSRNTTGGRICFSTTSRYIHLKAKMPLFVFPQVSEVSASGFDMIVKDGDKVYTKLLPQPYQKRNKGDYSYTADLKNNESKDIILNFPLFNSPTSVEIWVEEGKETRPYNPYLLNRKLCFYGSSITHGVAVSRPSNTFANQVSLQSGCDYVNLGFSGNAKGEMEMAKYIASLNSDIVVIEYDHNSSLEELKERHYPFVKYIKEHMPNSHIIVMSRPDYHGSEEDKHRLMAIKTTCRKLKDEKIHFLDGSKIYKPLEEDRCSVDGTHPNDIGSLLIQRRLLRIMEGILNGKDSVKKRQSL